MAPAAGPAAGGDCQGDRRRPHGMAEDEEALYDFCTELLQNRSVSDTTYARSVAKFGERPDWRTGFPTTVIDDRPVQVVQAMAGGSRVKLFFDKETGLLSRVVRYSKTIVGSVPIQMDYSDYREVAGVKMPFQWRLTWTDGQSMYTLDDVQPNVAIDPAKFAKPLTPAAPAVAPAKVVR